MSDYYVLKDGQPVAEPDTLTWARWMEQAHEERVVEKTTVGDVDVSTVFLGLDHGWGEGDPVLWETLVFGGPLDGRMERYTSREAAVAGHAGMVAEVRKAGDL